MTTAAEAAGSGMSPIAADLAEGVEAISLNQSITFKKYRRLVLPLDGYVFWVLADMVAPSALYNKLHMGKRSAGGVTYNETPGVQADATTLTVLGSLHYATDTRQEEAENFAANRVVFTSLDQVTDLNAVAPNELWIGEWEGVRFAFSSRSSFYRQASLWHYVGFAVYADMATQIIDSPVGFDAQSVIVSNSLPAWLALNGYNPPYGFGNPSLILYPSFLTPPNLEPPYAAVHVVPETTVGLASAPRIDSRSSHAQLCSETVRITLWGTRNFSALDFVDCVNQYSLDTDVIGIMNVPVVRDEKRTQSELGTIAQKKTVEFQVSYVQSRMNDVARQIIQRSVPSFYVDGESA